jgi:hypothetical protein
MRIIRFADNSVVNAKCNDKVMIQRKKGKESCISEVLYVPWSIVEKGLTHYEDGKEQ